MRRSKRGFTLVEMIVTILVLGVVGALVVPLFQRTRQRSMLNDAARKLIGNVSLARSRAAKGETNAVFPNPTDRAVSAGIRLISDHQYAVFIDRSVRPDTPVDVVVVDFRVPDTGSPLRITTTAPGAEVRFRSNGVLTTTNPVDFVLTDTRSGLTKTVRVSPGGSAKFL